MKKILYTLSLALFLLNANKSEAQALNFTITPANQCYGTGGQAAVTSTPAGTTSYSWSVVSSNSCIPNYTQYISGLYLYFPCAGNFTFTCYAFNGTSLISSVSVTTSVGVFPTFNLSGNTSICTGATTTLNLNGGASYTWFPGNFTGSTAVLSPTVSTNYTVTANNLSCSSSTVVNVSVSANTPTVSILGAPSGTACSYGLWLTASGATNFTWLPGNSNATNLFVNPVSNPCYTLLGTNGCGSSSTAICLTVVPGPTLSITGANTVCAGGSLTLAASGASSYSWAITSGSSFFYTSTLTTVVISPTVGGILNVNLNGWNGSGCSSNLTSTILVMSAGTSPTVSSTGGCSGGTVALTASGATSYTWMLGGNVLSNLATLVVSPTVSTYYQVLGSNGGPGCPGFSYGLASINATPTVGIGVSSTLICLGWTGNTTIWPITNASTYTWNPGGYTGFYATTPTVNTCYTVTVSSVSGCTASASQCFTVLPAAPLVVSGNTIVCLGSAATYSATGGTTYSWTNWQYGFGTAGPQTVFTPTAATTLTLYASNSLGCSAVNYIPISVVPSASISVFGVGSQCAGGTYSMYASGVNSYTWSNGTMSALNIVTPTTSACYTITGTSGSGCVVSAVKCVTLYPLPTINISGSNTVCSGSGVNLIAGGANTYVWSNSSLGTSIIASPLSNTCYTVTGTSSAGCVGTGSICLTVLPVGLGVSPSSTSVCLGTSTNFSASGANSYTWSTGANTNTVNILPTISTSYYVSGLNANGCVGSATVSVNVNTTCADVWPGDANSDGIVNASDVLELGLQFAATGSARTPGGNSYTGQYATNWTGIISTGKNKCHADCNGDGVVNNSDTIAISNNFSMTHAFRPGSGAGDADLSIIADQNVAYPGRWNKANILLGSNTNQLTVYGLAFDLIIDQTLLDNDSTYFVYTTSYLSTGNQNIEFKKSALTNSKIHLASVRTDQSNVLGGGKIGEVWFNVKQDAAPGSIINLSIGNHLIIDNMGASVPLTAGSASILVSGNLLGLANSKVLSTAIQFYPNPAKDQLILQSEFSEKVNYTITDLLGRDLLSGDFCHSKSLDLGLFEDGTYLIKFESISGSVYSKLVIEK